MKYRIIILLMLCFWQNLPGFTQTVELSQFPYKSPEALSFQRYGEYEGGEYTGNPTISIPLYNLKYRDIEIPINLTYQGGGIRVNEEASWVGLGWNLAVGGCINHIPAGTPDTCLPRIVPWNDYKTFFNQNPAPYYQTNELNSHSSEALTSEIAKGKGEWDFYSVTLAGKSFLFFINPYTNNPTIIGKDNEQYKIGYWDTNANWLITDDNGTEFYFANREIVNDGSGTIYTSTWNLIKIKSQTGATAIFNYSSLADVRFLPQVYQKFDFITGITPISTSQTGIIQGEYHGVGFSSQFTYNNYYMTKSYLSSITTDDQTITFSLNSRQDIEGASRKLDTISVTSKITGARTKNICFNYSYFISTTQGGDYMSKILGLNMDYRTKRLKLLSVEDGLPGQEKKSHSFEYEESQPLPYKTSYAVDFWGFYNGQANVMSPESGMGEHTFIPTPSQCYIGDSRYNSIPDNVKLMKAADRLSREKYMIAGTLKKIIYPTKGYSKFSFESHRFSSFPCYPEGSANQTFQYSVADINHVGTSGGPTIHQLIELDQSYEGTLEVTFSGKTGISLIDMKRADASVSLLAVAPRTGPQFKVTLNDISIPSDQSRCSVTIPVKLTANKYSFTANLPASFGNNPGATVAGVLRIRPSAAPSFSTGAGLRIKSVENYGNDNTLLEKTEYEYSNGILLCPMKVTEDKTYYSVVPCYFPESFGATKYEILRLSSEGCGIPAYTNALRNGVVGYSRVSVKKSGGDNGTSITYFTNQAASNSLSNLYLFPNGTANGNITQKIALTSSGDTIRNTVNTYSSKASEKYKCNVTSEDRYQGVAGVLLPSFINQGLHYARYNMQVYSYYRDWIPLTRSVVTDYVNNKPTISVTHDYEYNTTNHLIMRDKTSSSQNGKTFITEYAYPVTFPTEGMYKELNARHIWNPVVQRSLYTSSNGIETLLSQKKTEYAFWTSAMVLPSYDYYALSGGNLEKRIAYTYDVQGNVRSMVKDGTEKIVYLWGYNSLYPVAKIEGATYVEVEGWLTTAIISNLAANTTTVPSTLNTIRNKLYGKGVMLTTYTYQPLVGMTSMTTPSGEVTTYEYDNSSRLTRVKDHTGKIVEQYDYHYKL